MLPALLTLATLFALLLLGRVGGARRRALLKRWPAVVLAGAAIFAFARGLLWPGIALAAAAALAWELWPRLTRARPRASASAPPDPADAEARTILGVGPDATSSEIRAAFRTKMAQCHPDRGGSHAEAARLTAARDRLLRKMRLG